MVVPKLLSKLLAKFFIPSAPKVTLLEGESAPKAPKFKPDAFFFELPPKFFEVRLILARLFKVARLLKLKLLSDDKLGLPLPAAALKMLRLMGDSKRLLMMEVEVEEGNFPAARSALAISVPKK